LGDKIVLPTVTAMFAFGLLMSTYFYPNVLHFQAASQIGHEVDALAIPEDEFLMYGTHSHSLDFYSKRIVPWADPNAMKEYPKGTFIFTDQKGMEELCSENGPGYEIYKSYDDFYVTAISFEFLFKESRSTVLNKKYLLLKI
jgi:hypothetical protein